MAGLDSFVKLLLHCNGADTSITFTDASSADNKGNATVGNNAQVDTAQSKFGGASLLLDGTTDYLKYADSADWEFGTGDFTIDMWVRFNSLPTAVIAETLACHQHSDSAGWFFRIDYSAPNYVIKFANYTGASYNISVEQNSSGLSTNTWYHFAVVRSGTSFYIFQDGVQQGATATDADTCTDNVGDMYIGSAISGGNAINGWMDEIRISKGIARWTANFDPPKKEYGDTEEGFAFFM